MRKLLCIVLLANMLQVLSAKAQEDVSLQSVLMSGKIICNHLFMTDVKPYISANTSSANAEVINPTYVILPNDMEVADVLVNYGIRALNSETMSASLLSSYKKGALSKMTLIKGKQNVCTMLVKVGDRVASGYIIDAYYSLTTKTWHLDAYFYDDVSYIPAGSKVFSY